jgi:protein-disulfide isomerase
MTTLTRRALIPRKIVLGSILLIFFSTQGAFAQPTEELKALTKELETLKEGQKNIQKELEAIKSLLTGRQALPPPPQEVVLSVEDNPFRGDKKAELTLIEFSDYQCPFCARHFRETLPQIEREYIGTGKVKYVFRDFPIESIHPQAFKAAEAAHCAGEQGKYWEMHDRLFADQNVPGLKDLSQHAQALGLGLPNFEQCLNSGRQAADIRKNMADGQKAGVQGTPTFFLGRTDPNDPKVKAVKVIQGAQPYTAFKQAIESLLSQK